MQCEDQTLTAPMIFGHVGAVVFVIDAQDQPYTQALTMLTETVVAAHTVNPALHFEVFIHKVDGDLFASDDRSSKAYREIGQKVLAELRDAECDANVSFYLTSIYDHSIFEAFSKLAQKLIVQLPTLENLLNVLVASCNVDKAFLFDVVCKIYIATDSTPVDMQSYELCSDMIDVVIDVSCIYGLKDDGDGYAYDDRTASVIRLQNGQVLYMREVNSYLALVCLLQAEHFGKQALLDHNIDQFRAALSAVFAPPAGAAGAARR